MATIQLVYPTRWVIQGGISQLLLGASGPELFDQYDLSGDNAIQRLVEFKSTTGNEWFSQYLNPTLYDHYPVEGSMTIFQRKPSELGVPPLRAVWMSQKNSTQKVSTGDIAAGKGLGNTSPSTFVYDLSVYAAGDYYDLRQQCAAYMLRNSQVSPVVTRLASSSFPDVMNGTYDIEVQYVLPGTNQVSSTHKISFVFK
jgi:hypothetical protein